MSAEKQHPSPVEMVAQFANAINLERRQTKGKSSALRDVLTRVVSDYNRMVTNKHHRVDSGKKNLALNLILDWFSGNV